MNYQVLGPFGHVLTAPPAVGVLACKDTVDDINPA